MIKNIGKLKIKIFQNFIFIHLSDNILNKIEIHRLLSDQKHIVKLINSWEDFHSLYILTEFCPKK